jgi:pseudoazurin
MRFFLILILIPFFTTGVLSKTVEVEMWTNFNDEKKNQRYEPLIVSIDIGDTIIWKSVEKSHNVEFMKGGVPEGVGDFKSAISQDAEFTFTIPGVYAYICSPHKTGKMVGFIIVGNDKSNLENIKELKYRGPTKKICSAIN